MVKRIFMKHEQSIFSYKEKFEKAVNITLIEMLGYVLLSFWENIDIFSGLRTMLILFWIFIVPFGVVWYWSCFINCYSKEVMGGFEEQDTLARRVWLYIGVIIVIFFGVATRHGLRTLIDYITGNWNLLDRLSDCIVIKLGICIGWMICFVGYIVLQNTFYMKGKLLKKMILCVCACLCICGLVYFERSKEDYIYKRTEEVWYEKMVEYYDQHGNDYNVEPFSRN